MQDYTERLVNRSILTFDEEFEDDENATILKMYHVNDGYSIILDTIDDLDNDVNVLINYIGEVYENVNGTFITFICVNENDEEIDIDEIEGHLRVFKQITI